MVDSGDIIASGCIEQNAASPTVAIIAPCDSKHTSNFGTRTLTCARCNFVQSSTIDNLLWDMDVNYTGTTQDWVNDYQFMQLGSCPRCRGSLTHELQYHSAPPLVVINPEQQRVRLEHEITLTTNEDSTEVYKLAAALCQLSNPSN